MLPTITRRELLAGFLGVPWLIASGCRSGKAVAELPPGELVGASAELGHRIRDRTGETIEVPADRWRQHRVVVVGAGVGGLSAARRLVMAGIDDVLVLELEPAAGGTARSGRSSVTAFPWGAHYVPAPLRENRALVALLKELGAVEGVDAHGDPVIAEQFLCRDPQERIFYKGRWYEGLYLEAGATAEDRRQLERFESAVDRWVAWRDGRQRPAFAIPMALASDDPAVTELDRLSMAEWLDRNGFTSPRLRWLVDYACRDDYGLTADQTSAWAGLFYFAARKRLPGSPSRPFLTWPEGNGRLVAHLARPLGTKLRTGCAVVEIVPQRIDERETAEVVVLDAADEKLWGVRAEAVIFAAPHFLAPYLIRPWRDDPPRHVSEFSYGVWAVANLHLKDRPFGRGFPLCWDNVLYESPSLGYVTATHQRGPESGPTVFTYYFPLCDDDPTAARRRLLHAGRDEWAEIALSDLQRAHPDIRQLVERIDVMRWGHAMIQPRPGFVWGTARRKAQQPYRNIYFAHSDLSGLALFEEAFYRGNLAAEQLLAEWGEPFESIL